MSIDYMWDEMDYARSAGLWTKGSTADPHSPEEAFNAGWRAALEAAHAKASAGGEGVPSVKYWASPAWSGYYKVYDVCALFFDKLGGVYDTSLGYMKEAVEAVKATPCTTEAEARRIAGFENKEKP